MRSTSLFALARRERQEQFTYNIRKVPAHELTDQTLRDFLYLFNSAFENAEQFTELCKLLYLDKDTLAKTAITGLLRDCKLPDIEPDQYDARVMYFVLKTKNKIVSCIKTFDQLKVLPWQIMIAILCKPNPQLENYIQTQEQLLALLTLLRIPSAQFELVIESINLSWFMQKINHVDHLLFFVSLMAVNEQIPFLNCLDPQWLQRITGITKNDIESGTELANNPFYKRFSYALSKLKFLKTPDHFTPSFLKDMEEIIDAAGYKTHANMQENYIVSGLQMGSLNMLDESVPIKNPQLKDVPPEQKQPESDSAHLKKVGLFALGSIFVFGAVTTIMNPKLRI